PFHAGKIVLHNLKLKAERIFTHKKLHLTSLSVQLLGCSSIWRFFIASLVRGLSSRLTCVT
ncbi:hypothetical protein, partial [Escherichia coli]